MKVSHDIYRKRLPLLLAVLILNLSFISTTVWGISYDAVVFSNLKTIVVDVSFKAPPKTTMEKLFSKPKAGFPFSNDSITAYVIDALKQKIKTPEPINVVSRKESSSYDSQPLDDILFVHFDFEYWPADKLNPPVNRDIGLISGWYKRRIMQNEGGAIGTMVKTDRQYAINPALVSMPDDQSAFEAKLKEQIDDRLKFVEKINCSNRGSCAKIK